jgi:hypothetical protein
MGIFNIKNAHYIKENTFQYIKTIISDNQASTSSYFYISLSFCL